MSEILDQMRRALAASGRTRYAISKESGIGQPELSRLARGHAGMGFEKLELLARTLGLVYVLQPRKTPRRKAR